jgi:hypothetical protein
MPTETPLWLQLLGLLLALSGWAKVIFDYVTGRPRIRGRIFTVMRGQMPNPARPSEMLTAFTTYLYLLNTRRNSVHMLDYEMEAQIGGKWHRLQRVYGIHNIKNLSFLAPDGTEIKISNFADNLIYRRNIAVEYGKPLHGWIVFAGDPTFHVVETEKYRVTCIDVYRKRHVFVTTPKDFENLYLLQDMADVDIPESAKTPPNSNHSS